MNKTWIYWTATALLALLYIGSGTFYLTSIPMVQGLFAGFGYPTYIVPILAVVKIVAAVTILFRFSVPLSDFAYAGMFFHLILAMGAHIGIGDPGFVPALIGFVALIISFLTQNTARRKKSPYGSLAALRSGGIA